MNSEDQALDLCNANTKSGVDTTAHVSEEIIPRSVPIRMTDGDAGRRAGDGEALGIDLLARVRESFAGDEDNNEKRGAEELFLQKNNGILNAPVLVRAGPESGSNGCGQQISSIEKLDSQASDLSVTNEGDMDIGVDLSLEESGVLESEPATVCGTTLSEESASVRTGANSLTSDTHAEKELPKASVTGDDGTSSCFPSTEDPPPSPAQEEGTGHKHGAKRVTFPSDEEIVSGSVEPKDPWRHGRLIYMYALLFLCVSLNLCTVLKCCCRWEMLKHRLNFSCSASATGSLSE